MFSQREHQSMHYASWAVHVPRPDQFKEKTPAQHPELGGETARRAAFFAAVARHGFPQGFQNLYMPEALTLEAYHPYLTQEIPSRMAAIGGGDINAIAALVGRGGFDVLHVPLLRDYGPSIFDLLDPAGNVNRRDVFLDPAHGYFYESRQGRLNLVPLAFSHWVSRLTARHQQDFGFQYLSSAASDPASLLTAGIEEGAFIGAALFERFGVAVTPPNAVPELPVANEQEFNTFVEALRVAASQLGGFRLWFRGQTREHVFPPVDGLGSGPRSRRRPSLVPAVFRELQKRTDDLDKYRELVLRFGRWSYWAGTHLPLPTELTPQKAPIAGFEVTFESRQTHYDEQGRLLRQKTNSYPFGLTELGRALILQHYGAPTAYLDITSDSEMALWFALNELVAGQYEPHKWSGEDPFDWPVIYVMALLEGIHPFIDSAALWANTDAVRPQRQNCGLLGGSGNLFRNFPACFVAAVFRLKPGFAVTRPRPTCDIFPGPDEDPFLKRLLAEDRSTSARNPADSLFPVTSYR